ncbi:type II toxin-antitoxin system VapC family toxin [Herbiconiux sp.]|uniref:type II toxin-antitoxin system VapC family toxin n=1 Tax=Herbiconiux sp. TaxID=1871186 RepID=UPI0025C1E6A0|nr:type II toxin-antitoxin system VapC family toxin [Herbiconiux sp.]
MIYADSNVIIHLTEDRGPIGDGIRRRFEQVGHDIVISPLVMMECKVKPLREDDHLQVKRFDQLFATLPVLDIPRAVYEDAAVIRARHGLQTMDAIHLATAQFHLCVAFWTRDLRLKVAAGGMAIETF